MPEQGTASLPPSIRGGVVDEFGIVKPRPFFFNTLSPQSLILLPAGHTKSYMCTATKYTFKGRSKIQQASCHVYTEHETQMGFSMLTKTPIIRSLS